LAPFIGGVSGEARDTVTRYHPVAQCSFTLTALRRPLPAVGRDRVRSCIRAAGQTFVALAGGLRAAQTQAERDLLPGQPAAAVRLGVRAVAPEDAIQGVPSLLGDSRRRQ
jgi:hypothetical protein